MTRRAPPHDPCGRLTFRDDAVLPFRVIRLRRAHVRTTKRLIVRHHEWSVLGSHVRHHARLLLGDEVPYRARLLLVHVEQCREPTRAALALRASLVHEARARHGARPGARHERCAAR